MDKVILLVGILMIAGGAFTALAATGPGAGLIEAAAAVSLVLSGIMTIGLAVIIERLTEIRDALMKSP